MIFNTRKFETSLRSFKGSNGSYQRPLKFPFYAGYFSTVAISGEDKIITRDSGNGSYAQYVIYQEGTAHKVVLINTDYYSGNGERNETIFTLRGLESSNVQVLRMTAPSSEVKIEVGQEKSLQPTIGGMTTIWPRTLILVLILVRCRAILFE